MKRLKNELKLKDGTVYSKGTQVSSVSFIEENPYLTVITILGREIKIRTLYAHLYLPGFTNPPKTNTVGRWLYDGYSRTVTGKKTEPDGVGSDGSPSWLKVLGIV